jgi:hypothetical protein
LQGEKYVSQISPDPSGSDLSIETTPSKGSGKRSGSDRSGENGARALHPRHGPYDRFIKRS